MMHSVFVGNICIGHIKRTDDGDLVGIVPDYNPQIKVQRPWEIWGCKDIVELEAEMRVVFDTRVTGKKTLMRTE